MAHAVNSSFNEWMQTAELHVKSHKHIFLWKGKDESDTKASPDKSLWSGGKSMYYSLKNCEC